jgi:hypothetical protein
MYILCAQVNFVSFCNWKIKGAEKQQFHLITKIEADVSANSSQLKLSFETFARFEVFMAVKIQVMVFWVVMLQYCGRIPTSWMTLLPPILG